MAGKQLTVVKGQPTSEEVRAKLAAEGRPVCLAFSCGKDSLAAWIALRDAGIEVVPAYMYYVPGLQFVQNQIKAYEDHFQTKIHQYPHPLLFHALAAAAFQAPQRIPLLAAMDVRELSYQDVWQLIIEDLGLSDNWLADGVRAGDSIVRRASLSKHGVMKLASHKVSVIHDWLKGKVIDTIKADKAPLSNDYEVFGRSFDGFDARYTGPLRRTYPEDYARLVEWFPLIDTDQIRWERLGDPK